MPFRNMTNDYIWNIWQDGIQISLISALSNTEELRVRQKDAINRSLVSNGPQQEASVSPDMARIISKQISADLFIYGIIQKAGTLLRISVQVIDTKTDDVLKSIEISGMDDQAYEVPYFLALKYGAFNQIDKKISEFEKVLESSRRFREKNSWIYPALGEAYHLANRYREEKKLYREGEKNFTDKQSIPYSWLIRDVASLCLTEGDSAKADKYIGQFIAILEGNAYSDADIQENLGLLFKDGHKLDKAEECYRDAISLEPDNPGRIYTLVNFFLDNDLKINEVLDLIDKCLSYDPDRPGYLDAKG
jgi:tetratricopeptide (TPR) repeat protein